MSGRLAQLLAVTCLFGCDAQVDPSYAGEPLVRLHGTAAGFDPGQLEAARIVWNANVGVAVPSGPTVNEPIFVQFPSSLTVDILGAPPDEAFFAVEGESASLAEGYLRLVDGAGAVVGGAIDVALVYVRGEPAEGSVTAEYLGGVRAPGYHLLAWRATADLTPAQRYFSDRCVNDMVTAGKLDAPTAESQCVAPRRYKLIDSGADLDTSILFYRGTAVR